MGLLLLRRRHGNVALVPPIQLCNVLDPAAIEPRLVPQGSEEMTIRISLGNFDNARIGEMVIVVVGDDDCIDDWDIFDLAWCVCEALRT